MNKCAPVARTGATSTLHVHVLAMADSHLKNQLKNVIIRDIKETGIVIGCGAYGEVLKMEMKGMIVAGKRIHNRLMEAEDELERFCFSNKIRRRMFKVFLVGLYFACGL